MTETRFPAALLKKPILIGGLGLTAGLWLWDGIASSTAHWGGTIVWGSVVLGSGLWWLTRRTQAIAPPELTTMTPVDRTQVEKALADLEARLHHIASELVAPDATKGDETEGIDPLQHPRIAPFRQRLDQIRSNLERTTLQLVVVGGPSVGKTALTQHLLQPWSEPSAEALPYTLSILDTEALAFDEEPATAALPVSLQEADLLVFVTSGDLTHSQFRHLQPLATRQRTLLAFNKQDQYLPADRPALLQQLRDRVPAFIRAEDVIAVAAAPAPVKVRRHQADGSVQEWMEPASPTVTSLTQRLDTVLRTEGQSLILATGLRQCQQLKAEVQQVLNQARRDRALPLIERYQWMAAATAFANPVPSLDLLATAAINTQLVLDLSGLYRQQISIDQAKAAASTLAELMVKFGFVELTSQAISPFLKSHLLTFAAGGTLQGISAAYLTRLAGLSLVEYFQEQDALQDAAGRGIQRDRLLQKLQQVFQESQRAEMIRTIVLQGLGRLVPAATPSPQSSSPSLADVSA
ncbi:MAG: DUF697 domain-containing protein [Synechococcales bacterium]|nr:DUF697 domain-containing protein [Synechococcales bacterium]